MDNIKLLFNTYFVNVVKNEYALFEGRIGQRKYWMFALFNLVISIALSIVDKIFGWELFGTLFSLAILIPSIGLGIRRMHDTNHSGWFILIPFYNLYLAIIKGDEGSNQYGEVPKE